MMDEAGSATGPGNPPQGHGLIVQTEMTQADGHAGRKAALAMIQGPRQTPRGRHLHPRRRRLQPHPHPETAGQTHNLSQTPKGLNRPTQSKAP